MKWSERHHQHGINIISLNEPLCRGVFDLGVFFGFVRFVSGNLNRSNKS